MTPDEASLLARLDERVRVQGEQLNDLRVVLGKVNARLQKFEEQAARWRGGLALAVGLGGFVSFLVNLLDKGRIFLGK